MDVKILNDQMYGVEDDNGVQTAQKPIPDSLKSLPDKKLRLALRELENMPPVEVAEPLPPAEKKEQVAYHEHPEYLLQMPAHSHDLTPHIHLMGDDVKARFEEDEKAAKVTEARLLQLTGELRGDMLTHEHPGYAAVAHTHADLVAAIELTERKLAIQEKHVHEEAPAHLHPEFGDIRNDLADLRSTVIGLGRLITELSERVLAVEQKPAPQLEHRHEEYATTEQFESHLRDVKNRPVYFTAEISNETVSGKKRFIVEEAPR